MVVVAVHCRSHSHSHSKSDHAGGNCIAVVVFVDDDRLSHWRRWSGVYGLWVVLWNIDHLGISGLDDNDLLSVLLHLLNFLLRSRLQIPHVQCQSAKSLEGFKYGLLVSGEGLAHLTCP